MKHAMISSFIVFAIGFLLGNHVGFDTAYKRYNGAKQDEWRHYGCTPAQQAPNGECQ